MNFKRKTKKRAGQEKRPMSSYFIFMNHRRPQIKEMHPGANICEVVKIITKEWHQLSEDDK